MQTTNQQANASTVAKTTVSPNGFVNIFPLVLRDVVEGEIESYGPEGGFASLPWPQDEQLPYLYIEVPERFLVGGNALTDDGVRWLEGKVADWAVSFTGLYHSELDRAGYTHVTLGRRDVFGVSPDGWRLFIPAETDMERFYWDG